MGALQLMAFELSSWCRSKGTVYEIANLDHQQFCGFLLILLLFE
jgi:hypothetical protein